jgi:putative membrane protein
MPEEQMKTLTTLLIAAGAMFAQNQLSSSDREFVDRAAQLNMTEAHLGQMAQQQGHNDGVKALGATLQRDHVAAYQNLQRIGKKDGFDVPKSIDSQHQAEIAPLQAVSGDQFDTQFRQQEVTDHQQAKVWFQSEAAKLTNPDLKAYADQMASSLENHLRMA